MEKVDLFNPFSFSENNVRHHVRLSPIVVSLYISRVSADGCRKHQLEKNFSIILNNTLNPMSSACCVSATEIQGPLFFFCVIVVAFSFLFPVSFCIKHILIEEILKIHLYFEEIAYIMFLKKL